MDIENNQAIADSVKSKSLVKFQVTLVACNFLNLFYLYKCFRSQMFQPSLDWNVVLISTNLLKTGIIEILFYKNCNLIRLFNYYYF